MIIKSYSKINLSLSVNRKLCGKKLHDIQSYFCLINLFDKIKIKKIKGQKDKVKFQGRFSKYIKKEKNSVHKALSIMRKRNLISSYYSVLINKKIPVFAGLGGGTSNAYFITQFLARNKLKGDLLKTLIENIGTDFRIFLYRQGFLKNLETIIDFPVKYKLCFLLVYPNINCSTKYVYSKINKFSLKSHQGLKKINSSAKFVKFLLNKDNDLQSVVENKYPDIKRLIKEISKKKGCYFSRMTGSGSACYGVFKSDKTAKFALKEIKLKHPNYWLSIAKTI